MTSNQLTEVEKSRCRLEDNIRMYHGKTVREVVDCVHLTLDRNHWRALVNTIVNIRVP